MAQSTNAATAAVSSPPCDHTMYSGNATNRIDPAKSDADSPRPRAPRSRRSSTAAASSPAAAATVVNIGAATCGRIPSADGTASSTTHKKFV